MIIKDEKEIYEDYRLCSKCGAKILPGNAFCTKCGNPVGYSQPIQSENVNTNNGYSTIGFKQEKTEHELQGGYADRNAYDDNKPDSGNKKNSVSTKPFSKISIIIIAILVILLIFAMVEIVNLSTVRAQWNEWYYSYEKQLEDMKSKANTATEELDKLKTELETTKNQLEQSRKEAKNSQNKVTSYRQKASNYDTVCNFLRSSDAGRASDKYYAEDKIVVLKRGDSRYKLPVYSKFSSNSGYTIYYSQMGYSVNCEWDTSDWTTKTYLYVSPLSEGITTVTFTNSLNSQSFRVLIVVTD